jgi:hypothetical protein
MLKPFCVVSYRDTPQWDSFVKNHPHGSLFHYRAMIQAYESTHLYSPLALAATTPAGEILALIVATRVGLIGEWANSFTGRSIHFAEPLRVDSAEGEKALRELMRIHDEACRHNALFTEIRPIHDGEPAATVLEATGYSKRGYHNFELNLDCPGTEIWKGFTGTCRRNIKRAERRGVTVEAVDPFTNVTAFYTILKESYANSRIPLVDISHFFSVFRELEATDIRLIVAKLDGNLIAASCFVADDKRVYYWFAGTKRVPGISAMASIVWDALQHYCQTDKKIFDFCGAGWEGEDYGPGRFKAHFGGKLTNIGRFRKVHSQWKYRLADVAYSAVRGILAPKVANAPNTAENSSVESSN